MFVSVSHIVSDNYTPDCYETMGCSPLESVITGPALLSHLGNNNVMRPIITLHNIYGPFRLILYV